MRSTGFNLICALIVAGLLAAACVPAAPAPAAEEKPAAPPAEEKVTVTWYVRSQPNEQPWEQNIVTSEF